ncbi:hypothetical protein O181_064517 [Austropuccinia psidii MF-1]|uniref:Uncharacterized protein n=1 Tax=Austropuccinia psidii MF-1 TaxID=1389203 RepID=A0A9Q3I2E4_9BASI|nr:hypothetical protein [Austropuccinia psidii MF-1]
MEDITTRTIIAKTWHKSSMESRMTQKTSREERKPERPVLKFHKCGSTSNLAKTCTKKVTINEIRVAEEKEESNHDSAISEDAQVEESPAENIRAFFEVREVHTHFTHYSEDCDKPDQYPRCWNV